MDVERGRLTGNDLHWAEKVLTACWWQWMWRNEEIFNGGEIDVAAKASTGVGQLSRRRRCV